MNKVPGDDSLPKFFKVYLPDDSGDDLEIPISFNSCLPKSLPRNVIVKSIYGKIWKFKLRKGCGDDAERIIMVDGWKRIVKDEDLKGGEFLAFEFDGFRLFNFCVYGERTCKRLGSLVRAVDVNDESHGEDGTSSDSIVVLDEEDDDDDDDQESSDEDIIVLDDDVDEDGDEDGDADDEDDDDEDYGDDDESNEDVIVLDDDQDNGDKEKTSEDVIVLDDDDDDDEEEEEEDDGDDSADDENERRGGVKIEKKEKGASRDGEDDRQYLDDDTNPFFIVNQNVRYTRIPREVIEDYDLRFPEFVYLIDPLEKKCGKLKRKIEGQDIKRFESIIRRNQVKTGDRMICELVRQMNGLVCEIKVHVVRE